jgi:dienelactone hydrolase
MRRLIFLIAVGVGLSGCETTGTGPGSAGVKLRQERVAFPDALVRPQDRPVTGRLNIPEGVAGSIPAVVIAHGSAGIDGRGAYHAAALNAAGIATLEIDMHGRWGYTGGPGSRTNVSDGTLAVYGALKYLSQNAAIDPRRIGLMGFSLGANIAVAARSESQAQRFGGSARFAAFVPLYGPCSALDPGDQLAAPMQMHLAEMDDYQTVDVCQNTVRGWREPARAATEIVIHKDAPHGFDTVGRPVEFRDPTATRRGGVARIYRVEASAVQARTQIVAFFRRNFAMD